MRARLSIFVTFPLLLTFGSAQARGQEPNRSTAEDSRPDRGGVSGNIYRNDFYGFTYEFPAGYSVSSLGNERGQPKRANNRDLHDLASFSRKTQGAVIAQVILLRAVDLSRGPLSPKEQEMPDSGENTKALKRTRGPEPLTISGHAFLRTDFESEFRGVTFLYTANVHTALKGFALIFKFVAPDRTSLAEMLRSMETLRFDGAVGAAPADSGPQQQGAAAAHPMQRPEKNAIVGAGSLAGDVYTNRLIPLSYRFPSHLKPLTQEQVKILKEEGHRQAYRTDPEKDPEHREAEEKVFLLLYLEGEQEPEGIQKELVIVFAVDVSSYPRGTPWDFVEVTLQGLSGMLGLARELNPRIEYDDVRRDISLPGGRFAQARFQIRAEREGKKLEMFGGVTGTVQNGYGISWVFLSASKKQAGKLMESARTIRFEPMDIPVQKP